MKCKLCGAASYLVFEKGDYEFFQCRLCRFLFVHPVPKPAVLDEYYSERYYDNQERYGRAGKTALKLWIRRLEKIEEHLGADADKSILDVGCATGRFLEVAKQRNWVVSGVELSDFAVNRAVQKLGPNRVTHADFLSYETSDKFSALSAWAVLEHVDAPLSFLKKANSLLQAEGVLSLSTVNVDALNRRVFKEKWRYFTPPEHLSYFNIKNLRWALAKTGFQLIDFRTSFVYKAFLDGFFDSQQHSIEPNSLLKLVLWIPKMISELVHKGDILEVWARKLS